MPTQSAAARKAAQRLRDRKAGKCYDCPAKAARGASRCHLCAQKAVERMRAKRAAQTSAAEPNG